MPTNSYDLIVMGNDAAGMVAATLCARRGMRVLLARTPEYRASYQLGPHQLPVRALPFVGSSSAAVARVLEELHFDHALKRKLGASEPAFQLVAPGARIDVNTDDEAIARELSRELDSSEGIASAIAGAEQVSHQLDQVLAGDVTFPPTGFWERREVGRSQERIGQEAAAWGEQLAEDRFTDALIGLPAALATWTNPLTLGPESRARAFALWRRGTPRLPGDWQVLDEMFADKLENHSGEIRETRISELTFSWGKATGVRLENGEELGAEHLIAAMPLADLHELIDLKKQKKLEPISSKIQPAGYRYTLNLLVSEVGVPAGMANTVLFVADPEAPLIGDNALAIYVGNPDDAARVVVTVEASCAMPEPDQRLDDVLADLRVRIRQRLEEVMPFVGEHVLLAHSPNESAPAEGAEGTLELERPIAPAPLWSSSLDAYLGVSAVPYDIGIKRLTVASDQVLCGLGLEGTFAAGWAAARIATAAAGKKRDVAKDELLVAKR